MMKHFSLTRLACLAALTGLLAPGICGPARAQQQALSAASISVGDMGNPFFGVIIQGASDALKAAAPDVNITAVGADYDLNKQASQIDSFVSGGSKIIVLQPVDAQAIKPFVEKARAAGVVVAAVDSAVAGVDLTVMTNNVQAGEIACAELARRLEGKGTLVIIDGPPVSSVIDRVKGCKAVLARHPDIELLSDDQNGKGSRDGGLAVMQALLTRFPHIDAVFAINDPTAIGADLAARQMGRKEMVIASVDGSPDIVTTLKRDNTRVISSSAQNPYLMARQAANFAIDLFNGKKLEKETVLIDSVLVTKENVGDYGGWDAPR